MNKSQFQNFIEQWQFKEKVFQESLLNIETALDNLLELKNTHQFDEAVKILRENINEHRELIKCHDRSILNQIHEHYLLS